MRFEIDISQASTREALHELLATTFDFPGYYGMNWDAFMDCMGDSPLLGPEPTHVIFKGWNVLSAKLAREALIMKKCIADLAALNPSFTVEWVDVSE